jgi:drug/metabolite transporter (DMT)-like permease
MPLALVRIEAAPASLVQAAGPLVVTLLAAAFLPGEKPSRRMLGGVALGFVGIALVVGPMGMQGGSLLGAALVFCATFSYAIGTIWLRMAPRGSAPALALGQQAVSGVLSGGLALGIDGTAALAQPASIWVVAVILAVFSTAVPLTMFLGLVSRARAADASMVGYLQPVFATLIAATWLQEMPSWPTLAGGAVVLAAVWLVTSRRPPGPSPARG